MFAKLPGVEPIKSRLQTALTRRQAETFYLACLADALETACRVVPRPVLFLLDPVPDSTHVRRLLESAGLEPHFWERVQVERQLGSDLGERLEAALELLYGAERRPAFIVGSDSPSLPAAMIAAGLEVLEKYDLALGPTLDGGYWGIGVRQPIPGLLREIPWSTERVLAATHERAQARGLRVAMLEPWTDVDRPEDIRDLAAQISRLRANGDVETGRHSARIVDRFRLLGA